MITPTKPTWRKRLQIALNVFRNGYPRSRYPSPPDQTKASPSWFPIWAQNQPQWHMQDYMSYVDNGFNINSLIFQSISYKARSVSSAALRAYIGPPDEPEALPLDHELSKLIRRPNSHQSWVEFQQLLDVYLNISGNAYIYMVRDKNWKEGDLPIALKPFRPDRVFIVPKEKEVIGYKYVPEGATREQGIPILPEQIMHVKLPNPGDPFEGMGYGLSPMSALAQPADVDNMVTEFLNSFFNSGTLIHTYVTFDEPMEKETLAESKERFMELYGGYENWAEPAFLDSGGKIQRFGMDFEEMGFGTIDERSESRILGPLGVPLTLLPTRSGRDVATYNNKINDRRMFWEDILIPEMWLFEAEFQHYLTTSDGGWVAFDFSRVPALRHSVPELVKAWGSLVNHGVSLQQAAKVTNLPLGEMRGGDRRYLSTGLMELDEDGNIIASVTAPKTPKSPAGVNPEGEEGEFEQPENRDAFLPDWATDPKELA